jgi:hypothetical protein
MEFGYLDHTQCATTILDRRLMGWKSQNLPSQLLGSLEVWKGRRRRDCASGSEACITLTSVFTVFAVSSNRYQPLPPPDLIAGCLAPNNE